MSKFRLSSGEGKISAGLAKLKDQKTEKQEEYLIEHKVWKWPTDESHKLSEIPMETVTAVIPKISTSEEFDEWKDIVKKRMEDDVQKVIQVYKKYLDQTPLRNRPYFELSGPARIAVKSARGVAGTSNFIGEERFVFCGVRQNLVAFDRLVFIFVLWKDVVGRPEASLDNFMTIEMGEMYARAELKGFDKFLNSLWDRHDAELKKQIKIEAKELEKKAQEEALKKSIDDPIFGSW